ncbi:uncharacterized protein LOC124454869 [Xenia sp. Carnegie-2017]|uniref:uncharacterized protein LOC124454869 n=1 Tax=Xenia sp. Carnegie-2017 TaxID=2897299 RepID=UPI001F040E82|nr:uncharacterized protein LOC124454869 [Xenia sp. Carnegie-2017]
MALSRSGNRRVKPYSLTVKTCSASGKLSRKNISLSPNVVLPIRTIDTFEGFQENLNEEDGIPAKKAEIRCRDCSQCAESLHRTRNVFHLVEVWKTDCEMFVPLLLVVYYVTVSMLTALQHNHVL